MSFSDGNLDTNDLSANAGILGTQIADNTIQTRNLAPETIINTQIVDETITDIQIAEATIAGTNIAPETITSDLIAAKSLTAAQIQAGTVTTAEIAAGTITGDNIAADTITGDNIDTLDLTAKNITADTGTVGGWTLAADELVGPDGSDIRSGQTDFNTGTGFWLGNRLGTPKFSIGQAGGNAMYWDGTNLAITGALTPTTVFNVITYTTGNLPVPPSTAGPSSPTGNA